jgi:hypothetical protein
MSGDALETHYRHTLEELGKKSGMLGIIFRKAQNKIQDPAKLERLIKDLIDREQWMTLDADVQGSSALSATMLSAPGTVLPTVTEKRPYADRIQGEIELERCFEFSLPGLSEAVSGLRGDRNRLRVVAAERLQ